MIMLASAVSTGAAPACLGVRVWAFSGLGCLGFRCLGFRCLGFRCLGFRFFGRCGVILEFGTLLGAMGHIDRAADQSAQKPVHLNPRN